MKKYILLSIVAIALLFVVLNPTPDDFRNYIGIKSDKIIMRRTANYLFFSTYELHTHEMGQMKYRGIFKNFYTIEKEKIKQKSSN